MHLLLIRHAQSANNRLYADTGSSEGCHPDPPLTELGHAQAQALAEYACTDEAWQGVTQLHCSLTMRAVQTARPLAEALARRCFSRERGRPTCLRGGLSRCHLW